ncbi:IclR family transcriptional regulator [Kutzneria sp. CA-103260]|uniref:IclR family transcriptional regulator n=1 Tax=Kutzneria sp. CA-103260 TaxID=2802641 RepID=UPI001BA69A77|nr:helix-turn-helix domain-containing protein [Kutzneria sp. CA-103260]QUQ63927.1 acetate operon repressor [Kutzneria sp. CA-103260]
MGPDLGQHTTSGSERILTEVEPAVTGTQSVFRALSILHAFTAQQPTLTGPEVAQMFGYSLPTAYRLLRALEAEHFLVFDRGSRAYSPGPEILRLAGVMLHRDALVPQTQTSLIRLRALTGETVAVYWRLGNKCTCTQEMPSPHPTRIEAGIGAEFPLTQGAAGKALLLDLDEAGLRTLLAEPDMPGPVGGIDTLLAELEVSRERGYTLSVDDAVTIAAPIPWLRPGLAAYTVSAPASRFGPQALSNAATTLAEEMDRLRSILRKQNPFG